MTSLPQTLLDYGKMHNLTEKELLQLWDFLVNLAKVEKREQEKQIPERVKERRAA